METPRQHRAGAAAADREDLSERLGAALRPVGAYRERSERDRSIVTGVELRMNTDSSNKY